MWRGVQALAKAKVSSKVGFLPHPKTKASVSDICGPPSREPLAGTGRLIELYIGEQGFYVSGKSSLLSPEIFLAYIEK